MRQKRRDMQLVFQDPYSSLNPAHDRSQAAGRAPEYPFQALAGRTGRARPVDLPARSVFPPSSSTDTRISFPAVSVSASAIASALITARASSWPTSRYPRWMSPSRPRCSICSWAFKMTWSSRTSLSLTTSTSSATSATASASCIWAASSKPAIPRRSIPHPHAPLHPSPALRDPAPRPSEPKTRIRLQGDVPSPANPPSGCPFHNRCPQCMGICKETMPQAKDMGGGHLVSCHLFD